jgi:hypothetical protein
MGERHLDNFVREVGALGYPISFEYRDIRTKRYLEPDG